MTVQFIETESGRLAVLPEAEYRRLAEAAEDAADAAVVDRFREKLAAGEEELVPAEIVSRLLAGENPVRVWREWRGLTARALAEAAGVTPAFLSQIEGGQRDGSFETMRKLAAALGVTLDDLAPPAEE